MATGRMLKTIDAAKLMTRLQKTAMDPAAKEAVKKLIWSMPEYKKTGHWDAENGEAICSECGSIGNGEYDYCPWCGMPMDTEEDDDE